MKPVRRRLAWAVLASALVLLVGSVFAASAITDRDGSWSVMGPGPGMAPGTSAYGPVGDLDEAGEAAGLFAERWGLHVEEVMQFDNGFYAELVDPSGRPATEVLIAPRSGRVQLEWGPAMMWNTAYGMHRSTDEAAAVSAKRAREIANAWLARHREGERAGEAEPFPGYYTLHTLRGDEVIGMLSVHAITGDVWHHGWHGTLIDMTQHDEVG